MVQRKLHNSKPEKETVINIKAPKLKKSIDVSSLPDAVTEGQVTLQKGQPVVFDRIVTWRPAIKTELHVGVFFDAVDGIVNVIDQTAEGSFYSIDLRQHPAMGHRFKKITIDMLT